MALGGSMGDDDVTMSLSDGGRSPYLYRLQRVRALRRTAPPLWVTRDTYKGARFFNLF